MSALRSALFNAAFFVWTALSMLVCMPLLTVPRAFRACMRFWAGGVAWLLEIIVGVTTTVRGRANIPDGPVVFASKHQSAWDTIMFFRLLPHPAYVVKQELTRIPVYSWLGRATGWITVDREGGGRAMKGLVRDVRAALAKGHQPLIFPEGTRSAPGQRLPYQPGVAALYALLEVPVVPVALNSGQFWGRRSFMKHPGRIVVEFLPPIFPGLDKQRFLAELEERIETATTTLIAESAVDKSVDK